MAQAVLLLDANTNEKTVKFIQLDTIDNNINQLPALKGSHNSGE